MTPTLRPARREDLPAIVALLADDALGRSREGSPDDPAYADAFAAIEADPGSTLHVLDEGGRVVGCAQLTLIPGLSHRGMTRALVEGVRVASDRRGGGLGRILLEGLIGIARERGCGVIQLTTDRSRADAHRFYEGLGFSGSHLGFKLVLRDGR